MVSKEKTVVQGTPGTCSVVTSFLLFLFFLHVFLFSFFLHVSSSWYSSSTSSFTNISSMSSTISPPYPSSYAPCSSNSSSSYLPLPLLSLTLPDPVLQCTCSFLYLAIYSSQTFFFCIPSLLYYYTSPPTSFSFLHFPLCLLHLLRRLPLLPPVLFFFSVFSFFLFFYVCLLHTILPLHLYLPLPFLRLLLHFIIVFIITIIFFLLFFYLYVFPRLVLLSILLLDLLFRPTSFCSPSPFLSTSSYSMYIFSFISFLFFHLPHLLFIFFLTSSFRSYSAFHHHLFILLLGRCIGSGRF